jgi:hypothetical protein
MCQQVTWTGEWWRAQSELDACRAAWCIRTLAFRQRALILEVCASADRRTASRRPRISLSRARALTRRRWQEEVAPLLRCTLRVSTDEDTDTACAWALLALQ